MLSLQPGEERKLVMNIFPKDQDLIDCFSEAEAFGELKVYIDQVKYPKTFMVYAKSQRRIDAALIAHEIPDLGSKEIKRVNRQKLIVRFRQK